MKEEESAKREKLIDRLLEPSEVVELSVKEHKKASPQPLSPAILFVTNKRIIIMRRSPIGVHKDYKAIKYETITEVVVESGMVFSKIHFGLQGEHPEKDGEEWKKWVHGLSHDEVISVMHAVEAKRHNLVEIEKK